MELYHSDKDNVFSIAVDYLENRLDKKTSEWYKDHLTKCNICLEEAYQVVTHDLLYELIKSIQKEHINWQILANMIVREKLGHPGELEETVVKHLADCKGCNRVYNYLNNQPYDKLLLYQQNKE